MLFDLTRKELKVLLPVILIGICGTLGIDIHFLSLLESLSINYIIGVKPKDHQLLFDWGKAICFFGKAAMSYIPKLSV